jgi:excisionase family DNA binding protein
MKDEKENTESFHPSTFLLHPSNEFLTTGQLAKLWGLNRRTVRTWIATGKLKAERVGAWHRIPVEEARRFAREHQALAVELLDRLDGDEIDEKELEQVRRSVAAEVFADLSERIWMCR